MDFGIARSTGVRPDSGPGRRHDRPHRATSAAANVDATVRRRRRHRRVHGAGAGARAWHVDQRADIYAFGLILYDMLVGRTAIGRKGESPIAELQARMKQRRPGEDARAGSSGAIRPDHFAVPRAGSRQAISDQRGVWPRAGRRSTTRASRSRSPPRFSRKLIAAAATLVIALVDHDLVSSRARRRRSSSTIRCRS